MVPKYLKLLTCSSVSLVGLMCIGLGFLPIFITLVFLPFIFMPCLSTLSFILSIIRLRPLCVSATTDWSSANFIVWSSWPPTFNPSPTSSIASLSIASAYMLKSVGDNRHPCLTTRPIKHGSVFSQFTLTTAYFGKDSGSKDSVCASTPLPHPDTDWIQGRR